MCKCAFITTLFHIICKGGSSQALGALGATVGTIALGFSKPCNSFLHINATCDALWVVTVVPEGNDNITVARSCDSLYLAKYDIPAAQTATGVSSKSLVKIDHREPETF